jgi:hypothetical protein
MAAYRKLPLKTFPYWFSYREALDGELVALVLFHHKQTAPRDQLGGRENPTRYKLDCTMCHISIPCDEKYIHNPQLTVGPFNVTTGM